MLLKHGSPDSLTRRTRRTAVARRLIGPVVKRLTAQQLGYKRREACAAASEMRRELRRELRAGRGI